MTAAWHRLTVRIWKLEARLYRLKGLILRERANYPPSGAEQARLCGFETALMIRINRLRRLRANA
jgi:hypothetical protein